METSAGSKIAAKQKAGVGPDCQAIAAASRQRCGAAMLGSAARAVHMCATSISTGG
jgi:hypothetical protein